MRGNLEMVRDVVLFTNMKLHTQHCAAISATAELLFSILCMPETQTYTKQESALYMSQNVSYVGYMN